MTFEPGRGGTHGCVCPLMWGTQRLVLHFSSDSLSHDFVFLCPASDLELHCWLTIGLRSLPEQTSVLLGELQDLVIGHKDACMSCSRS